MAHSASCAVLYAESSSPGPPCLMSWSPPPVFSHRCGSDGGALHAAAVQVDSGLESIQVIRQQQAHQVIRRDRGDGLVDGQVLLIAHGDVGAGQVDLLCWLLGSSAQIGEVKQFFLYITQLGAGLVTPQSSC
jgi:hypothetical protein